MAKFNFNLRAGSATASDHPVPVRFIIRWGGQVLTYPTNEVVAPKHWCNDPAQRNYQRAKSTRAFPEFSEFNERLDDLLAKAKATFRSFTTDNGREPTPGELRQALDLATGRVAPKAKPDLVGYIEAFIERSAGKVNKKTGKPLHSTYHGRNRIALQLLKDYVAAHRRGRKVLFTDLDIPFVEGFTKYMTTTKGFATNTVGKYLRALRMFVNSAAAEGIEVTPAFRSKAITIPSETTDSIYLSTQELEDIFYLDLRGTPRLERVRDLFLLQAWVGLRFSTLATLSAKNVEGELIRIRPGKTGEPVVIPLHPIAAAILNKYGGYPPTISNQKFNGYLKEVAALVPCLKTPVVVGITKGGIRRELATPKFNLVSSHTARRSFASNMYLAGDIPVRTIMKVTGHTTEAAFLRYIRLDGEQHANIMAKSKLFTMPMLKAV